MGDGPVQQDHLASDVVHEVLARDLVPGRAHEAYEGVPEERVAGPADMQRPGGVRARVLEQDPLLPRRRGAVCLTIGTDGGEDQLREGGRIHGEVDVRAGGPEWSERGHRLDARGALRDRRRRRFQLLGPSMRGEGEEAVVGGGLLECPGRGDAEFGLDGAPDPLRAIPELGPWVVAHHVTRYLRMAAMPPNALRSSCPSSESFEMSSTVVPIPPAIAVRSSMRSWFSTTVRAPPSFVHGGNSPSSATVFSPSQSPSVQRSLSRDLRRPSEMRSVSTAPSCNACRTWSSPYAARPPSSLRISSIRRCTRDFSRIRSRPLRISRDFSTSSRRPYSSV